MAVYFELYKFAHLPFVYYSMKPTVILALAIALLAGIAVAVPSERSESNSLEMAADRGPWGFKGPSGYWMKG